jgi:hypothetical protein
MYTSSNDARLRALVDQRLNGDCPKIGVNDLARL